MATASNTSSAPIEAQNSPRSRQSRRPRDMPSPSASPRSLPISGIVDQEQFLTSSSSTSSDSLPIKEANTVAFALGEDGLATGAGEDIQLENGENAKKPAWSKPSNGATADAGAVMDAESWPALSESARASPKSPLKALSHSHGSISVTQDMVGGSLPSPKEFSSSISSPNSVSNNVSLSRHKRESVKRTSGNSSNNMPSSDNFSQAPSLVVHSSVVVAPSDSHSPIVHSSLVDAPSHSHNTAKSGGFGETPKDITTKDVGQRGGSYTGNELHQHRSFRKNNSGPLTRGDGSYHNGRRDQERGGKQDWGHRSFGSRESHGSQQRTGSRPFLRGPAPTTPFVPPPPVAVRPFVAPVVYTEMMPSPLFYMPGPHPESLRPMSMVPMPSMFFSMHDPHLPSRIMNQIEYYFSNENLVKDTFLRQNMDGEGWVSIKLIAGFKKVMQLTDNVQLILDVIKASNAVEVQGDKVRRKGDWMKWIMSHVQTTVMSPQSINRSSPNLLAAHLNSVTLDEKAAT